MYNAQLEPLAMHYPQWAVGNRINGENRINQPIPIDPACDEKLTSLIAYESMVQGKEMVPVVVKSDYTTQVLLRLGWSLPQTGSEDVDTVLPALVRHGMFGSDGIV